MPAPPENKNALKHGIYAKRIPPDQSRILAGVSALGVEHEIAVLRAAIDNILGGIEAVTEPGDLAMLYNSLFNG